jgi:hypothetical protein
MPLAVRNRRRLTGACPARERGARARAPPAWRDDAMTRWRDGAMAVLSGDGASARVKCLWLYVIDDD